MTQGDYAEARLIENGIRMVPAPPAGKQMDMLLAGRIDFWVANRGQAQSEARRSGVHLRELFAYEDFDLYLACNPAVPNDLTRRMNAAVKQVWDSGEGANITARFTALGRE
jgi:polar amino acid transport system substrate-binding protein